jgi:hypothetical protein
VARVKVHQLCGLPLDDCLCDEDALEPEPGPEDNDDEEDA